MSATAKHRTPLAKSRQRLRGERPDLLVDIDPEPLGRRRPGAGRADRVSDATAGGAWVPRLFRVLWLIPSLSSPRAVQTGEDEHLPHPA